MQRILGKPLYCSWSQHLKMVLLCVSFTRAESKMKHKPQKKKKTQKTHSPRMNSSKIYLSICSLFTQNYLGVGKWGESLFPSGLAVDLFITFRFPGFCLHLLWQRWWFFCSLLRLHAALHLCDTELLDSAERNTCVSWMSPLCAEGK